MSTTKQARKYDLDKRNPYEGILFDIYADDFYNTCKDRDYGDGSVVEVRKDSTIGSDK